MANNHNNPNNFQLPSSRKSPQQVVSEIVAYIRAGITLILWLALITMALGLGYIALQGTLFAVRITLRAIGL